MYQNGHRLDPSHNYLRQRKHKLDAIFAPRNVAVIGASERPGSVGRTLLWNLISHPFGGTIFPVNPHRSNVLGIKAYPSLSALPDRVDLAVIATPAETVPGVIAECVAADVKGAIIISAGFKELGANGEALEAEIRRQAQKGDLRIIGPNCLGVMNPLTGLNATFASAMARPGNVAFISQSGALCTAILDWSFQEQVGFSAFVSIGSMMDISWGDLIDYLGDDARTQSIVIYMESIGDAGAFLSAAREVAMNKPIIVIKAGRTEAAAKAAASHTGSMTGSDDVLDAAFRRCGVLRVNTIEELFNMAEVLSKQPRPQGPRLTILTNAGGPGVIATDALITNGGTLAELESETCAALEQFLPPHWNRRNPVDILGDANPERYSRSLEVLARDPASDGLLVILTPQDMTEPTQIAEQLRKYAHASAKPILASWMGGADTAAGKDILNRANIPTFDYPDTAARVFNYMHRYHENLLSLYETPAPAAEPDSEHPNEQALQLLDNALAQERLLLSEFESKQLLALYGIPTVPTRVADSAEEAVCLAEDFGFPVVLKLHSETLTHKTDVGGVMLNLADAQAVQRAFHLIEDRAGPHHFQGVTVQPMIQQEGYELIIGSSIDSQFGPVLLFGSGGQLVEIYKDSALALPPLNTTLARRLMEQTKIFQALQGIRGREPIDIEALAKLLVRFSLLVVELPRIREIDINPLLASPQGLLALDARIVLHPANQPESRLPKSAIRPYPNQYVKPWRMRAGMELLFSPIRPEDEPLLVAFHETLSERSVYFRYFNLLTLNQRTAHERLTRLCFIDYNREMALTVKHIDAQNQICKLLAIGRLSKSSAGHEAEFALVVSDRHQGHGIGTELLRQLIEIGRREHLAIIRGHILGENQAMQAICRKLGFKLAPVEGDDLVEAVLAL